MKIEKLENGLYQAQYYDNTLKISLWSFGLTAFGALQRMCERLAFEYNESR